MGKALDYKDMALRYRSWHGHCSFSECRLKVFVTLGHGDDRPLLKEPHTMSDRAQRRRVLIMGAAGRGFHHFLCCYRDDPQTEVVAFAATQIPNIAGRRYPASLAGRY